MSTSPPAAPGSHPAARSAPPAALDLTLSGWESLAVLDLIDSRETRPRLIRALESAIPALANSRGIKDRPGVRP